MDVSRKTEPRAGFSVMFLLLAWLLPISAVLTPAYAEDQASIQALRQIGKAFTSIAEKASPSVVGIEAVKVIDRSGQLGRQFQSPFFDDDLFRYFFGPRFRNQTPRSRREPLTERAQGSGFIISKDGYIITNNHVVDNARDNEVTVKLSDERELTAKVVGTDPESDVAVIKIDVDDNLPFLELADSDLLEVGEWVVAIGNPFGLNHSVTSGIVSAKGRNRLYALDDIDFQDFIQTDAAINPGNSGGPLLDLDGKVVGMNTAILGPNGANAGIGFAIPVNMIKVISDQLIENGKVVRGYLGVNIRDLTDLLAETLDIKQTKGALIDDVRKDTPAEKAGIKKYDVIVELNGQPIENANDLMKKVAALKPGTKVELLVLRDGREKTITVTLAERPTAAAADTNQSNDIAERLGFDVTPLTDELKERLDYRGLQGVVVESVDSGSDAERNGLRPGMLIVEVNREVIKDTDEFYAAVEEADHDGKTAILLYVTDGTRKTMIPIKLSQD